MQTNGIHWKVRIPALFGNQAPHQPLAWAGHTGVEGAIAICVLLAVFVSVIAIRWSALGLILRRTHTRQEVATCSRTGRANDARPPRFVGETMTWCSTSCAGYRASGSAMLGSTKQVT